MSKFVLFDNSIVNVDYIICAFPDEIAEWAIEENENKYLITMRLSNGSSLKETFRTVEARNKRYDELKIEFLYDE
jgi:hypothetical protein